MIKKNMLNTQKKLKQALNKGQVLKKANRVIKFN